MKFAGLVFFAVLFFFLPAEARNEKSVHQYCKEQGHQLGTLAFERCCDRRKREEDKKKCNRSSKILGRDLGGKFDRSRVHIEELAIVPRPEYDPLDLKTWRKVPPR